MRAGGSIFDSVARTVPGVQYTRECGQPRVHAVNVLCQTSVTVTRRLTGGGGRLVRCVA